MGRTKRASCIFIYIVLILGCINIYDTAIFAAGNKQSLQSINQTDIAQIFITTTAEIQREDYISAEVTIIDAAGGPYSPILDPSARIKIRGNSTANLSKLPFNIKLDEEHSVLGMPSGKKWSLLANYLDTSLMRNKLSYDFAKDIGLSYSCEARYVDVWINGQFNGNYLITVPVEVGENRVDIDIDDHDFLLEINVGRVEEDVTYINTNIHRFEINEPEEPTTEQIDWLSDFLFKAEAAIKSTSYNEIEQYVDAPSFIDFFILQELFKNMDGNSSSVRFYIKDGLLYAGPLWDLDLSAGNVSTHQAYKNYLTYNNWGTYGNRSGNSDEGLWLLREETEESINEINASWIGNLMKCCTFRSMVYKRYLDLQEQIVNLYSDNSLGENKINVLLATYGASFDRDNARWPVKKPRGSELYRDNEKTFSESIAFLRNFLSNRNAWLLENMIPKDFLPTTPPAPLCSQAVPTAAKVLVNNNNIPFDAYNIGGYNYFKLRDLAGAVSGSGKQFQVEWDERKKAIRMLSNTAYTFVGGEFSKGKGNITSCIRSTSEIFKDGHCVNLEAYTINGNNYFKLRDVAKIFNIGVNWNAQDKIIEMNTEDSYMD